MTNSIVLLEKEEVFNIFQSKQSKLNLRKSKFICFDSATEELAEEKNLQHNFFENYLSNGDYKKIDFLVDFFKKNWFMTLKDESIYNGISCGEMLYYDNHFFFVDFFKKLIALQKILNVEKPKTIILEENSSLADFVDFLTKKSKIKIFTIKPRPNFSFKKVQWKLFNLKRNILRFGATQFTLLQEFFAKTKYGEKKKCILFFGVLSFYGNSIYKSLLKDKERILVVDLNIADRKKVIKGVEHKKLQQFIDSKIMRIVTTEEKKFKEKWLALRENNDFRKKFSFDGLNFWPLIVEKLEELFLKEIPNTIKEIELCKKLIEKEKPKIIIVWTDVTRREKCLCMIAKQFRIPSVVIQHGIIADPIGFTPLTADRFISWGKESKEILIKHGINPNRIRVTGSIRLSELWQQKNSFRKERVFELFKIDKNKKIILLATNGFVGARAKEKKGENIILAKAVINAVNLIPNSQLIIKPHPAEFESTYERIIKELHSNAIVTKSNLHELISAASAVLIFNSTVGLEAMILEKPVITINLTDRPDDIPYAQKMAAIGVYSEEEIIHAIKKVLDEEETRKKLLKNATLFVKENVFKLDEKSIQRIKDLILEMSTKK